MPLPAPRFGIGEWYGHLFVQLTREQRRGFAYIAANQTVQNVPPCPFRSAESTLPCTKKGGICSLRLYKAQGDGSATPVEGIDGDLRAVCQHRFKQDGIIYSKVGEVVLGTSAPRVISEVRFLRRGHEPVTETGESETQTADDQGSEDVGNIDNVLVHPDTAMLHWCALEVQAVYFSGQKMALLFEHIRSYAGNAIPFPDLTRRPDYRSSGPKRLMPQLQIKVPTLRRWGKKMAVVVDASWFRTNVVDVATVSDISNCDIAWFLVGFDETTNPATITVSEPQLQTLERAVEGLTGGYPVTLSEFESKIRDKLAPERRRRRRSNREPNPDSGR